MSIDSQLNQFFSSRHLQTLIFCRPFMDIDACVLCNAHSYSDLSPDEILSNTSDYDLTFTWEHWGEESHQWQLIGHQVFNSNTSSIPHVIVFYYSPCDKGFIENWMGLNQSSNISSQPRIVSLL